jgi:hypothetical protein
MQALMQVTAMPPLPGVQLKVQVSKMSLTHHDKHQDGFFTSAHSSDCST